MKTIYSEETEVKVGAGQSSAQIESALQDVIVRDLVHADGFQRAINQAGLTDERGVVADAGVYTVHVKVTTPSAEKKAESDEPPAGTPLTPEERTANGLDAPNQKPAPKTSTKK